MQFDGVGQGDPPQVHPVQVRRRIDQTLRADAIGAALGLDQTPVGQGLEQAVDGGAVDAGQSREVKRAGAVLETGKGAQQYDRAVDDLNASAGIFLVADRQGRSRRNIHGGSGFRNHFVRQAQISGLSGGQG
ncbi:hypothetical protein D3C76_1219380 [compost metagenome]